jgi:hypothetical protein
MIDDSNFSLEMQAFGDHVQAIETAAFAVYLYRGIDAALAMGYSSTLDDIGSIVGAPRYEYSDIDFAIAIKAKIQMNASQGEPERLISALQNIMTIPGNNLVKVDYFEGQPARVFMNVELQEIIPANLQYILDGVKSAGVALSIQQSKSRPFCFSANGTTPWYANGKGFGNNDTDENGGQLATPLFTE